MELGQPAGPTFRRTDPTASNHPTARIKGVFGTVRWRPSCVQVPAARPDRRRQHASPLRDREQGRRWPLEGSS